MAKLALSVLHFVDMAGNIAVSLSQMLQMGLSNCIFHRLIFIVLFYFYEELIWCAVGLQLS